MKKLALLLLISGAGIQASGVSAIAARGLNSIKQAATPHAEALASKIAQAKENIIYYSYKAAGASKNQVLKAYDKAADAFAESSVVQSFLLKSISAKNEVLGAVLKNPTAAVLGALGGVFIAYELFAPEKTIYEHHMDGKIKRLSAHKVSCLGGFVRASLALATIAGSALAASYVTDVVNQSLAQ